ncbi:MAG: GNAT family N-acetyltransferase [Candidatus Binataceae bacterium]
MDNTAPKLANNSSPRLQTGLAHSAAAVEEVQRLRYRVFGQEMGALNDAEGGLDRDCFDAHCDHLMVRDTSNNRVVGTYRILNAVRASATGGFYSEHEFDLGGLAALRAHLAEVGRACVDPAYRNGTVIAMLWSGLVRYARSCGYRFLMGCGSIPLALGHDTAGRICNHVKQAHLSPPHWRAHPRVPFEYSVNEGTEGRKPPLPALLKGYLRAGAYVCGEPAWDRDFGTADLLVLLPLDRVTDRYASHFLS